MRSINLILGNHNHQPVGNFDFVVQNAYENAYKPFLETLKRFPSIKFVMHYSGSLIDFIERLFPEHFCEIANLVDEGRIELMAGGYYEPILSAISERDAILQLRKLRAYLEKRFKIKPSGAWIAERVWEPSFAAPIAEAGLSYLALDDTHFMSAGVNENDLFGYYTTDSDGKRVNVFPISQALRYLIPFRPVEKVIEYLDSIATEEGDRVVALHDDGEKYGDWPETFEWVYTNGWLNAFFAALEREKSWINVTTYSEYMRRHPAKGRVYLPAASYTEMMEWALPAKPQRALAAMKRQFETEGRRDVAQFLRGAAWRNFFAKYGESNAMQKRMIHASDKAHAMRGDDKRLALDKILMGQCNCAYWHGTFGGIYLNALRYANYAHIIEGDAIAEKEIYGSVYHGCSAIDIDLDGRNEAIVTNEKHSLFFHSLGGHLYEWDYKPSPINIIDTLRRREEAYHAHILEKKEPSAPRSDGVDDGRRSIHEMEKRFDDDAKDYLVFDRNDKHMLVDHFLDDSPNASSFMKLRYTDTGDFANGAYTIRISPKGDLVSMERKGTIKGVPARIRKNVSCPHKSEITVEYEIMNEGEKELQTVFAVENNFTLLAPDAEDRYYVTEQKGKRERLKGEAKMNSIGESITSAFGAVDEGFKKIAIMFRATEETTFLRMPCITVSDAVDHLEKAYQHSTVVLLKPMTLSPKKKAQFKFSIAIEPVTP